MLINKRKFDDLNAQNFYDLIRERIAENQYLEYKSAANVSSDSEKRETLKDISGFANADGGLVIFGSHDPYDETKYPNAEDAVVGIPNAVRVLQTIENLCSSSVDPRIPGLQLRIIEIPYKDNVILALVPPSPRKPHMVQHGKARVFYKRHSESSQPMTTDEIVSAVLTTTNRSGEIQRLVKETEEEMDRYVLQGQPGLIMQAIPEVRLSDLWDVHSDRYRDISTGGGRRDRHPLANYSLSSNAPPTVGVGRIIGKESYNRQSKPFFQTEIHQTGQIVAAVWGFIESFPEGDRPMLVTRDNVLFCSFGAMVDSCLREAGLSVPMAIFCTFVNAENTFLHYDRSQVLHSTPESSYSRERIEWYPISTAGYSSAEAACSRMIETVFHAFGIDTRGMDFPTLTRA